MLPPRILSIHEAQLAENRRRLSLQIQYNHRSVSKASKAGYYELDNGKRLSTIKSMSDKEDKISTMRKRMSDMFSRRSIPTEPIPHSPSDSLNEDTSIAVTKKGNLRPSATNMAIFNRRRSFDSNSTTNSSFYVKPRSSASTAPSGLESRNPTPAQLIVHNVSQMWKESMDGLQEEHLREVTQRRLSTKLSAPALLENSQVRAEQDRGRIQQYRNLDSDVGSMITPRASHPQAQEVHTKKSLSKFEFELERFEITSGETLARHEKPQDNTRRAFGTADHKLGALSPAPTSSLPPIPRPKIPTKSSRRTSQLPSHDRFGRSSALDAKVHRESKYITRENYEGRDPEINQHEHQDGGGRLSLLIEEYENEFQEHGILLLKGGHNRSESSTSFTDSNTGSEEPTTPKQDHISRPLHTVSADNIDGWTFAAYGTKMRLGFLMDGVNDDEKETDSTVTSPDTDMSSQSAKTNGRSSLFQNKRAEKTLSIIHEN